MAEHGPAQPTRDPLCGGSSQTASDPSLSAIPASIPSPLEKPTWPRPRKQRLAGTTPREALSILEEFHVRAVLAHREYDISLKDGVHASWARL